MYLRDIAVINFEKETIVSIAKSAIERADF